MIKFSCTSCGHEYKVSSEHAGKKTRCKNCNNVNTIPQSEDASRGSGDSIAAYNDLLQELLKQEKTAPTIETER